MSTDSPTPERVTLTDEERALGQQHSPHRWFREDAVERILAAREQALREEIAGQIEARETFGKGSKDYAFGFAVARRTFARIARGGAR